MTDAIRGEWPTARGRALLVAAAAAVIAVGVALAVHRMWVCDDAFISFRYARNLVRGEGLVFNPGERVEGYTNFLWTMLVAGGIALGADAERLAQIVGIAFFAATCALLLRVGWRIRGGLGAGAAAIGFALHEHAQRFASCGLETAMFWFLYTATLVSAVSARGGGAMLRTGLLATLATMTRPDGALAYAAAAALLLPALRHPGGRRRMLLLLLPAVVLYAPYFAWKWSYYGWPLPNTFYAKSAASPYPDQGWFYLRLYFQCYAVLLLGLIAAVTAWAVAWRQRAGGGDAAPWRGVRAPAAVLLFVLPYAGFVTWVGGDFMFGRFLMPITPALLLGIELLRARFANPWFGAAVLVACGGGVLAGRVPEYVAQPDPVHADLARGILEEHRVYTADHVEYCRRAGELLRRRLHGTDARVAIFGGQAMLAWYADFPVAIECATGLTDEHLAHLELRQRARIGHEKGIALDPDYLVRRRVHFLLRTDRTIDELGRAGLRDVHFGEVAVGEHTLAVPAILLVWQEPMMRHLRAQDGVAFHDLGAWIDSRLPGLAQRPVEDVRAELEALDRFYFDHNDDARRRQAHLDRIGS